MKYTAHQNFGSNSAQGSDGNMPLLCARKPPPLEQRGEVPGHAGVLSAQISAAIPPRAPAKISPCCPQEKRLLTGFAAGQDWLEKARFLVTQAGWVRAGSAPPHAPPHGGLEGPGVGETRSQPVEGERGSLGPARRASVGSPSLPSPSAH